MLKYRLILIFFISLLIIASGYAGYKVYTLSEEQEKIKQDYGILNNITYGLLSVNKWRDLIVASVSHRMQNFRLTKSQEATMRKEVDQILHSLINKAVSMINKPQKTFGGRVRKFAFNAFIDVDNLHATVPAFSKQIISEIKKPSSTKRLNYLATSKLKQLSQQTYDSARQATQPVLDSILRKYNVTDTDAFEKKSNSTLSALNHQIYLYSYSLLASIIIIFLIWLF